MIVGNPFFTFRRVSECERRYGAPMIKASCTVNGVEYSTMTRLPPSLEDELEEFLAMTEEHLARTVGSAIIKGENLQ